MTPNLPVALSVTLLQIRMPAPGENLGILSCGYSLYVFSWVMFKTRFFMFPVSCLNPVFVVFPYFQRPPTVRGQQEQKRTLVFEVLVELVEDLFKIKFKGGTCAASPPARGPDTHLRC